MRRHDVAVDLFGGAERVDRVVVTLKTAIGLAERNTRVDRVLVLLDRLLQFRQRRVVLALIEQFLAGGQMLVGLLAAVATCGESQYSQQREEPVPHGFSDHLDQITWRRSLPQIQSEISTSRNITRM